MRPSHPSSYSNADTSALKTIKPSLVLSRGSYSYWITLVGLLAHHLPQDGEFPAGKNFLRRLCMPWASQAAQHLENAQLIKFDICVASGRALGRLRKAASAVITSLWAEEQAPISLPACTTINPPAHPLPPSVPPLNGANDTLISVPSCRMGSGMHFLEALG